MSVKFRAVELGSPEPLPFRRDPAYFVVGSEAELARALGVSRVTTEVDWDREFVIVVQRGECPTGGHTVAVEALTAGPRSGELTVKVRRADPTPADFVTMVVTYPKCAVAVTRTGLGPVRSVVFVDPSGKALRAVDVRF